jgi:hypothetical protein
MDIWQQIRCSYAGLHEQGVFEGHLERWACDQPALRELRDFAQLVETCAKSGRTDFDRRDRVLAALCVIARKDQAAKILVCHMMLSALLDVARELADEANLATDDLHAELLANFWDAVSRVDAGKSRVAQRLKNAAKFRTLRFLAHQGTLHRREEPTDREIAAAARIPRLPAGDALDRTIAEAISCHVLSVADADLVRAPKGQVAEASRRLGLSARNGRARRQKAKARLRRWIDERAVMGGGR